MRTLAALLLMFCLSASAQTALIDSEKLPNTPEVREAFRDLVSMETIVDAYHDKWPFKESKKSLTKRLTHDMDVLKSAQATAPHDVQLNMLLGLAAHFGYNLDMPGTPELTTSALTTAMNDAPTLWQPETLLGIHFCSTLKNVDGMQHLLHVEKSFSKLPNDFWRDEMLCALMTNMPAHAIYAADKANLPANQAALSKAAHERIKVTSTSMPYPALAAWQADSKGDTVRFTSHLCGIAFTVAASLKSHIPDVRDGKCVTLFTTENYPGKVATHSSATYMVLSVPITAHESVNDLKKKLMGRGTHTPSTAYPCPVKNCESYDISAPDAYSEQGGAHSVVLFFQTSQPKYPGLRIEEPSRILPPDPKVSGRVDLHPGEVLGRLPGDRLYVVLLDSSVNIFDRALPGFQQLLKSMVLDTD